MEEAAETNGPKTSLKLMVHKDENRVIFAEADSDFVDALFSLMTLPMGTIVRLLEKCPDEKLKAIGSLNNLYHSLMNLPDKYLASEESNFMMLNVRSSAYDLCRKLKLNIDDTEPVKYYICSDWNCHRCDGAPFSICNLARCKECSKLMNKEITEKGATNTTADGVFVSDVTTYIVTDDLHVIPNTTGFGVKLLCDLGLTDAKLLEEMTFDVGIEQILVLLKGAMLSKYSLTYMVFDSKHCDRKPTLGSNLIQRCLTSNEMVSTSEKMILKVTLQKSTSKFLFAEAEQDFVDFLHGFLEIPLGTLIGKLMSRSSSLESVDNLYASISNMNVGYIKSQNLKDSLLEPLLAWHYVSRNKLSLKVSNGPQVFCHGYISSYIQCAYLSHVRLKDYQAAERLDRLTYKDPRIQGRILKAGVGKFMLTDDLVLTPASSISTIVMLNKFNVSLNDTEEHQVSIGFEEGLNILKASLRSLSTLSDALLKGDNGSQIKEE